MDGQTTAPGSRFRRWRKDHGLSQHEVADLTGLSQPTISNVESGSRTLAPMTKVKVARRLGARISDLFDVEEASDAAA